MAILDSSLVLAGAISSAGDITGQLITSLGATVGQNTVDLGPRNTTQYLDIGGTDRNLVFEHRILQSLTSGGAATVQFQLVRADDPNLTLNVQVLSQTDAIPFATLTAGQKVHQRVVSLRNMGAQGRYFGMRVVIGGAVLTNATGWLFSAAGASGQDTGAAGRGVHFKNGFGVI